MKQLFPATLSALALALAAGPAAAQVGNGNFNGLAGWSTAGDAAATGGHLVLTDRVGVAAGRRRRRPARRRAQRLRQRAARGRRRPGQPRGRSSAWRGAPRRPSHFVTAYEGSAASQSF